MHAPPIVRIRRGRPADASAIARVYIDAWRSAYASLIPSPVLVRMSESAQEREWAMQLSQKRRADETVVAEVAGFGIVGFGSCGDARSTELPHAGEIFTLYVAPEQQDRGIGRALLLSLFVELSERGLNSALVWVLARNPARFFYEAMGGRCVARKVEQLWNTPLPQTAYGWDDLRFVINDNAHHYR